MINDKNKVIALLASYNPNREGREWLRNNPLTMIVSMTSAGKNTIAAELVKTGNFKIVVTDTTRARRSNNGIQEINGQNYWFVTQENFLENVKKGDYAEAAIVYDSDLYGSRISEIQRTCQNNQKAILVVDVDGCQHIMQYAPSSRAIFLLPPSLTRWLERIESRGYMATEEKRRRMQTALKEMQSALAKNYFTFFINDDLATTVKLIEPFLNGQKPDLAYQQVAKKVANQLIADTQDYLNR